MLKSISIRMSAMMCLLPLCGMAAPALGKTKIVNQAITNFSGTRVPESLQSAISAAIGRDQKVYRAVANRRCITITNPRSGFQATFTPKGVEVRDHSRSAWDLELKWFGEGTELQPVAKTRPLADRNQVEYRRGGLVEWYRNGPEGLEQGFTIARPPKNEASGILTLALGLAGNMTATVESNRTGLLLNGSNGQPELRYAGLEARDAAGRSLQSWLELQGRQVLLHVEAAHANYPVVVDPWIQAAELTASYGQAGDRLGLSVGVSADGTTVVAGAPSASVGSGFFQGAVYVFVRPAAGWSNLTEVARLTATDGQSSDELGWSVGVSADGSTVVAGALLATVESNSLEGAAYVFVRPSTGWHNMGQTAKLTPSDGRAFDLFGDSVSISADGSTAVAGAIELGDIIPIGPGSAYVFVKPSSGWKNETQVAKLTASDGQTYDQLGSAVAISADGSTVAAGAPNADLNGMSPTGAIYVFVKPTNAWSDATETAELSPSGDASYGYLGSSVGISADGSTVVGGAPYTDVSSEFEVGAAYIFVAPSGGWSASSGVLNEAATLMASDGANAAFLGQSASISASGATAIASAPGAMAAYVFSEPAGGWPAATLPQTEASKITSTNGDLNGPASMSADGLTVGGGAPSATVGANGYQGAAYVFSSAVPFDQFHVAGFKLTGGPHPNFSLYAGFIVAVNGSSVDPTQVPVTLVLGNEILAFPAGAFHQNNIGNYVFSGVEDGVSVNAQIKVLGANAYTFQISGSKISINSTSSTMNVVLSVGDNTGTAVVSRSH